jgi:hypothetical protein
MAWQRETEFKQLLSANIRHLTKEGLDKLVSIGVKDMLLVRTPCPAQRQCSRERTCGHTL